MIQISRPPSAPLTLCSEKVKRCKEQIDKMVASATKPKSSDFTAYWNEDDVREALWEMQHHKCCYCERIRDKNRESDVEHFRPKAMVEGVDGHLGYWWLAYDWDNLLFSCRICNQEYKRNHFPVQDESVRASGPAGDLETEGYLFLHPCFDDPEKHLHWYWYVQRPQSGAGSGGGAAGKQGSYDPVAFIRGDDIRGTTTVEKLGLNREELIVERGKHVLTMLSLVTIMHASEYLGNLELKRTAAERIRQETSSNREFLGLRRAILRAELLDDFMNKLY